MSSSDDGPGRPLREADVIIAYLAHWSTRRATRGQATTFARPDADVWVGYAYLLIAQGIGDKIARAVARREMAAHARLTGEASPLTVNVAGYLLVAGTDDPALADLEHSLMEGGRPEATGGTLSLAWRIAFLRTLQTRDTGFDPAPELRSLVPRLERAAERLEGEVLEERLPEAGVAGRVAHALALAGGDSSAAAARRISAALRQRLEGDGDLQLPSAAVGQVALAGWATGDAQLAQRCIRVLMDRVGPRRLVAAMPERSQLETSGWVPAALLVSGAALSDIEPALNPRAPVPPDYMITAVGIDRATLCVEIRQGPQTAVRRFSAGDFNLLVLRILDQLDDDADLSPRQLGHLVISLLALLARSEGATATRIERIMTALIQGILDRQDSSGGWRYGRANVPSLVYRPGGVEQTEFPDRQYTIDVAVPGLALLLAHRRLPDPRYLSAAVRALDFLEREIGRAEWMGRQVWNLYPGDDKTRTQGTAVNYELWVGTFMAAVAGGDLSAEVIERARGYVDDAVDYAASHLLVSGDIRYGDYVRELRTPYASWDAFLLAQIDRLADQPRARAMAHQIVARLAELQLSSGAIPNVVNYREDLDGGWRWLVHRHGVGPYPLRSYYQLYFACACAATGAACEAGLRALSFVFVEMLRTTFADMSTGYLADGRFDGRVDSLARVGRDWLLLALAELPTLAGFAYRPRLEDSLEPRDRLGELVVGAGARAHRLAAATGWPNEVSAELAAARTALATIPAGMDLTRCLPELPDLQGAHPWAEPSTEQSRSTEGTKAMRLLMLLERWAGGDRAPELAAEVARQARDAWESVFGSTGAPRGRSAATMETSAILLFVLAFARADQEGLCPAGLSHARQTLRELLMARTRWDGELDLRATDDEMPIAAAQVFRALAELYVHAPQVVR